MFSYLIIISFAFSFFHLRRTRAELALPDLVTKFTSTPAKTTTKQPPPPVYHPDPTSTVDMEFLIPQLPVSANGRTNLLIKGGGISSSFSSTSTSSSSASSDKARSKNATNGSILQSALNSLNSRQSGVNVAVIQAHPNSQRYAHPTSYNYSTSADSVATPTMRPHAYHKQTSVSHISAAMSTMLLQPSVSSHSSSSTSSLASTASLPATSNTAAAAAATTLMPPPPPPVQPHSTKMTKKQLKLAQAQLDKLTQINIHLHGMSSVTNHI